MSCHLLLNLLRVDKHDIMRGSAEHIIFANEFEGISIGD